MIVIPAVDVMDHKVVQLVGGRPGTSEIAFDDPYSMAMDWVDKGAPYLHLVDLDAAFGKGDNSEVFCRIIRDAGVPVEIGGGVRSEEKIAEYADAGADRIIVGTKAVTDIPWLEKMAERFPGKLMVGVDTKGGRIAIKGWQEASPLSLQDLFGTIGRIPVAAVLHTNIDVEGQERGIDRDNVFRFCADCPKPVVISGGVSTESDATAASKAGALGVVVGMALYRGNFRPWEFSDPWVI